MDEKPMEKEQEQPVVEKKPYTPPALIVYGKLTELTAGGSTGNPEQHPWQDQLQRP
ncbi:MAG TPA: lasso RiPP family leader peptide-containing protein [Anaerolineales bacterium]|nr:lasso RiPP family leader peptide-containing protein [Anaerolineales bacterium]